MHMVGSAARKAVEHDAARALYDAIGRFLSDHRLGFTPAHYRFAYHVLGTPEAPLARTVARLTDGGVRLTEQDVATLGADSPVVTPAGTADLARAGELVAQTCSQMEDFAGLVDRMRVETSNFGRDLTTNVDALDPALAPDLVRMAAAMLTRVRQAEAELESATSEAAGLRAQLEEARIDAREDPLTGLANRRALTEAYAAQTGECCLAICDIDHFKQVNDRFGHAIGDRVLTALAATLTRACAGTLVARYGGEEFAVLFRHGDLAAASASLDRARAEVAGKRYRVRDGDTLLGTITFSGGVVATAVGEAFDEAMVRADALLYRAKTEGRNRILN